MFETSPTIRESASQETPLPTSKADLFVQARAMVSATESTLREIANTLAVLQERYKTSQREIATELGKSQAWVCRMLQWRSEGFTEDTPFGPAAKVARERVKAASGQQADQATDQATDPREAAARKALAADSAPATDSAATSKAKPTGSGSGLTTQPKRGTQAWWLSEFQVACGIYLSKMDVATLTEAKAFAAAWQPECHLKVAA
jgi:hypothetical protein